MKSAIRKEWKFLTKALIDKAKSILSGIEIGYFITSKKWTKNNYDDYYQYFSHPDYEVRKYSLLVFGAGLGNWSAKSAFIFTHRQRKDPDFDPQKIYHLKYYIKSFLDNREPIKQEFPFLYKAIIYYLNELDYEKPFEVVFPSVDEQLFISLRKVLRNSGIDEKYVYEFNFNDILREVGLPTFFKN